MTALSVPNPSNRGCPSKAAGTTCRRDRSRISPSALRSTIRCRTDPSGPFRRCVTHPRLPRLSATIPAYDSLTRGTPTQQQLATGACSNFPTEPFPGLPVGDKRAFPPLTVPAPNSSQKYNPLQNWRERRPPHSRPLRRYREADVSTIALSPSQRPSDATIRSISPQRTPPPWCFNPHPTRRPDATQVAPSGQVRPYCVSILTRPEGRMRPGRPSRCTSGYAEFQSSPDPKAGCDAEDLPQLDVRPCRVSILTRPEGRMRRRRYQRDRRADGSRFNPHPTRRPDATASHAVTTGTAPTCFTVHPACLVNQGFSWHLEGLTGRLQRVRGPLVWLAIARGSHHSTLGASYDDRTRKVAHVVDPELLYGIWAALGQFVYAQAVLRFINIPDQPMFELLVLRGTKCAFEH